MYGIQVIRVSQDKIVIAVGALLAIVGLVLGLTVSGGGSTMPQAANIHHTSAEIFPQHPIHEVRSVPVRHYVHHEHHDATIYDSATPWTIPHGTNVAVYSDGPYSFGHVPGSHSELRIDITGGNPKGSNVLDVEQGGGTVGEARGWVAQSLTDHSHPAIYTELSNWQACKDAIAGLPGASRVRWWIADPNGVPHIVPGASATQYAWGHGFDKSLAKPGFTP